MQHTFKNKIVEIRQGVYFIDKNPAGKRLEEIFINQIGKTFEEI